MLFSLVLTYVFAAPYALGNDLEPRILYGQKADIREFPYFAALSDCGAAIISESWLVTAAHCVALDEQKFGCAWVGGNSMESSRPVMYDTVVIHPFFDIRDRFLTNNVALLRLSEPLNFSDTVQSVMLPEERYNTDYEGQTHTVVGKGLRKGNLMKIDVTPLSDEECLSGFSLMQRILMYKLRYKLKEYLCAKRIPQYGNNDMPGLSQGASGSPLVRDNTLTGLAVSSSDDPLKTTVSTFIKIARHTEWIRFITGIRSQHPTTTITPEYPTTTITPEYPTTTITPEYATTTITPVDATTPITPVDATTPITPVDATTTVTPVDATTTIAPIYAATTTTEYTTTPEPNTDTTELYEYEYEDYPENSYIG